MKIGSSNKHLSPRVALWHLGLRQTIKGAIIIGILAGFVAAIQGLGYASSYPDEKSRAGFAAISESAPTLGILYGEAKNLVSPAGYMVYRAMPFMALIAAIWGLMTVTKLLRGQEEDNRWEIITAGDTTARHASWLLMAGFGTSLFAAFAIGATITAAVGALPAIQLSLTASILVALGMFLPAALFGGIGALTSQLSLTKRRAVMYSLAPLAILFALRAIGNTVPDLYWLKTLTPFGWSDMISPAIDPHMLWLLPFVPFAVAFAGVGIYVAGKRDLGAGLIPESSTARSHYFLLKSPTAFSLRQNAPLFLGWGITALIMSVLISSLMSVAAEAVADSAVLQGAVGQLGGSVADLKVAFLGAGMVFVVIVLLIMATTSMANIRRDEAKNYLDNLLTQPVRRSVWLARRLLLIVGTFTLISLVCVFTTWLMAHFQGIALDLGNMLLIGIALTGTVGFTLGLGALLYGLWPRLAVIGMYIVIIWSFLIDIIGSVVTLNDLVIKSSLFHYIVLSPAAIPDWKTFGSLLGFGIVMAAIGIFAFTKRDIITE